MRKLLALILCVMLIVSVVPVSAFALRGGENDSNDVPAVDLSPAYAQIETLNNAYAALAAATAVKNAYDGFDSYTRLFVAAGKARQAALRERHYWATHWGMYIGRVFMSGVGTSWEGLFERLAPDMYASWNNVGEGVIQDVIAKEEEAGDAAVEAYLDAVDTVLASTDAAVSRMLGGLT